MSAVQVREAVARPAGLQFEDETRVTRDKHLAKLYTLFRSRRQSVP